MISGMYYNQVKKIQNSQDKDKLRVTREEDMADTSNSFVNQSINGINEIQPIKQVKISIYETTDCRNLESTQLR